MLQHTCRKVYQLELFYLSNYLQERKKGSVRHLLRVCQLESQIINKRLFCGSQQDCSFATTF